MGLAGQNVASSSRFTVVERLERKAEP